MHTTIVCSNAPTPEHITTYVDAPVHCTCCESMPKIRSTTELDLFQLEFNVSTALLPVLNRQLDKYNRDHLPLSIFQFGELVGMQRASITPLNVHCSSCGSVFTMLRSNPDTYRQPPTYCVYCGASTVSTIQQDPEQIAFLSLAEHYNVTVPMIQNLYKTWQQRPNYPTFQGFMQSDTVRQIKQIMEVSA